MNTLRPIDVLLVNGDMIDGTGHRSGGTEQITVDREEQCEMATYALRQAMGRRTKAVCTYGTAYHTGDAEDWERLVAHDIGAAKIGSHEWVDVNGLVFDLRHHVGASSIPHGRHTAVARERLWNLLWAQKAEQPMADVIIRSHVHYHQHCGGPGWLAMTTPALQGPATKYGGRRCSGTVDVGVVVFDVSSKEDYSWQAHIARLEQYKAEPVTL